MAVTSNRNPNLDAHLVDSVRPPPAELDELVGARPAWWWTGRAPKECPGLRADGALASLPLPNLATCTREEVLEYFDNGWTLTELLFAALQGDAAFRRPP